MKSHEFKKAIHNHIGQETVLTFDEKEKLVQRSINKKQVGSFKQKKFFPEVLTYTLVTFATICVLGMFALKLDLFTLNNGHPETLDTSLLKESEVSGLEDMSEEQRKEFLSHTPKSYYTDSIENGLKALPFPLYLPKKLPFDGEFHSMSIDDWHLPSNTDGRDISVNVVAAENNKNALEGESIILAASDFKQGEVKMAGSTAISLNKNITGYFLKSIDGGKMNFVCNDVYISIVYHLPKNSNKDIKPMLMNLANQMIK